MFSIFENEQLEYMTQNSIQILVPFDFTEAAEKAITQASLIDKQIPVTINLLHVVQSNDLMEIELKLKDEVKKLAESGIQFNIVIEKGSVLPTINSVCKKIQAHLMIIGTHGSQGIRQGLLGADILKLLKSNPCPSIVVQKTSEIVKQFNQILLPVGSHENYSSLVDAVILIASSSHAEVIIYSIKRPNEEPSEILLQNTQLTIAKFKERSILFKEVTEESNMVSFGFAKQTMRYAEEHNVDLIAIMPNTSIDHSYFANADKEQLLTNPHGIAILCSAGV
jgi:nucleotide-binding universal stress UspA family protein